MCLYLFKVILRSPSFFLDFLSGTDVFMEPVSGVFSRKSSGDVAFGLAKSLTIVIAKRKS